MHIDAFAGSRWGRTDTMDWLAAAAPDVTGGTLSPTTFSFAPFAPPMSTRSSSLPDYYGMITSGPMAQRSAPGPEGRTWSGTLPAPTRWRRSISPVPQRGQGRQLPRQRPRSRPSTSNSRSLATIRLRRLLSRHSGHGGLLHWSSPPTSEGGLPRALGTLGPQPSCGRG